MDKLEFVKNAIGANGFMATEGASIPYAGYINPTYWDRQLLQFVEANLVVAGFAKVYDNILGQDGHTLNVTVDAAPTAAATVSESDDVSLSAITYTQVAFTPVEYAKAYALSDKEARRSFFDVMANMTKKIGYALALNRDNCAISVLSSDNGNSVIANHTVASDIASSDTMTFAHVVQAATKIREDKLYPKRLIVSPGQLSQLSQLTQFSYVNQAGTDETLHGGMIGRIYGLEVYWSTQIAASSNKTKALVLGVDALGEPCFGICRKALPQIRTQRFELGRYTNVVGIEEFQIKVLRADGICTLTTYE